MHALPKLLLQLLTNNTAVDSAAKSVLKGYQGIINEAYPVARAVALDYAIPNAIGAGAFKYGGKAAAFAARYAYRRGRAYYRSSFLRKTSFKPRVRRGSSQFHKARQYYQHSRPRSRYRRKRNTRRKFYSR